jgi:hypothetical protein
MDVWLDRSLQSVLDNALIQSFMPMTTLHVPRLWQSSGRLIYRDYVCRNSWSRQCQICQSVDGLAVLLQGKERHNFLKRHADTAWSDSARFCPEEWYKLYVRAYHPDLALLGIRVLSQIISASSREGTGLPMGTFTQKCASYD